MKTTTITDPELINKIAMDLSRLDEETDVVLDENRPTVILPDTHVKLPGGYPQLNGTVITSAEVRELNGVDEEVISKSTTPGQMLSTILRRGTVRIGDLEATPEVLDYLLSGDRDAILLGIRVATFGEEVDFKVNCSSCLTVSDMTLNILSDIKTVPLENQADRTFDIKCKAGIVSVNLPVGITQKKILDAENKSGAEINTIFLHGCVNSINGMPVTSIEEVRNLSIRDREKITLEISKRIPGPKLNDIKKRCPNCDEEITISVSMVALFRS